jgi:hypothetical protein
MSSRAYTSEEIRDQFLSHLVEITKYWSRVPAGKSCEEKMSGLVFSILAVLDGAAVDLPSFELVPAPHEEDKEYHVENGDNYYTPIDVTENGILVPGNDGEEDTLATVHGDSALHELWHEYARRGGLENGS